MQKNSKKLKKNQKNSKKFKKIQKKSKKFKKIQKNSLTVSNFYSLTNYKSPSAQIVS